MVGCVVQHMAIHRDERENDLLKELTVIKRLIYEASNKAVTISGTEQRLESKVDRVLELVERQEKIVSQHNQILFGDGENVIGIIARHQQLEAKLKVLWWVLGTMGTAAIVAAFNFIASFFKK